MMSLFSSIRFLLPARKKFQPAWDSYHRGLWGEEMVARYLKRQGYRIEARRWVSSFRSDIDLVAANADHLLFAEVKLRGKKDEDPWAEIYDAKRSQAFCRSVSEYLVRHDAQRVSIRLNAYLVHRPDSGQVFPEISERPEFLSPMNVAGWKGRRDLL